MLEALREVLAWAAVFNHALTAAEVRQHLATSASLAEVEEALTSAPFTASSSGRWHLSTSSYTPEQDAERRMNARAHLEEVGPVLAQLAASPTVEAMAITGSVAAGVNDEDGDVDLLIITRPGHVWRVRALAIYLQHNVEGGYRICPNMVLSRDNVDVRPSAYAARELAMMRPLKGEHVFEEMISHNPWFSEHLPNAAMREPLGQRRRAVRIQHALRRAVLVEARRRGGERRQRERGGVGGLDRRHPRAARLRLAEQVLGVEEARLCEGRLA